MVRLKGRRVITEVAVQSIFRRFRRAVRAFESERTDDTAAWNLTVRLFPDELDGGWVAECLELPGCMSEGATEDEALRNLVDAASDIISLRMRDQLPTLGPSADQSPRQVAVPVAH